MNKKAFTLVELIVVVTILAILSTVWFVSYSWYLTGVRDANRISQLVAISDGLKLYSTNTVLPMPDDPVNILASGSILGHQWYAGESILELIDYSRSWLDPKDKTYFSYSITANQEYHQLMAFLEEADNVQAFHSLLPQANAALDYSRRYPTVYGDQLWTIINIDNIPIQEINDIITLWWLDIELTNDQYRSILTDGSSISWTWSTLLQLTSILERWGRWYYEDDGTLVYRNPESTISRQGLVAEYHFDGTFNDSSWNANHGTSDNGFFVNSEIWKAIYFDNLPDKFVVPDSTSLDIATNAYTLSVWFRPKVDIVDQIGVNFPDFPWLIWKRPYPNGGYAAHFLWQNGSIIVQHCDNGTCAALESPIEFFADKYYHYVGTFDGTYQKLYIDGEFLVSEATTSVVRSSAWNDLSMWNDFMWAIDNVRVYNRAVDAEEVRKLYNESK